VSWPPASTASFGFRRTSTKRSPVIRNATPTKTGCARSASSRQTRRLGHGRSSSFVAQPARSPASGCSRRRHPSHRARRLSSSSTRFTHSIVSRVTSSSDEAGGGTGPFRGPLCARRVRVEIQERHGDALAKAAVRAAPLGSRISLARESGGDEASASLKRVVRQALR